MAVITSQKANHTAGKVTNGIIVPVNRDTMGVSKVVTAQTGAHTNTPVTIGYPTS